MILSIQNTLYNLDGWTKVDFDSPYITIHFGRYNIIDDGEYSSSEEYCHVIDIEESIAEDVRDFINQHEEFDHHESRQLVWRVGIQVVALVKTALASTLPILNLDGALKTFLNTAEQDLLKEYNEYNSSEDNS